MKRHILVLTLLLMAGIASPAQEVERYKQIVKELSSSRYQGRGYAMGGANLAGAYLQAEFEKSGVDGATRQPFLLDINTFPGKMKMSADGRRLKPAVDFTLREYSPGFRGTFPLYHLDTLHYDPERIFHDLSLPENKDAFIVCDFWFTYKHPQDFKKLTSRDGAPNAGVIYTWNTPLKFYKAYGHKVADKPIVWTTEEVVRGAKSIKADIENRFYSHVECFNVIAKVNGRRHDSCYVFTAHYDHLGNLGRNVFFPGANDNASGTAALVTLASYYASHPAEYDMYFIAFSGEDANLRGSEWYAAHPIVPLSQIRYLINLDMIGDNNPVQYCEASDEGMRGFALMESINAEKHYFEGLNRGKLAANSDHYPFAKRGVPCLFLENKEGDAFPYYHTPEDDWNHFIWTSYEKVFLLVTDFIERY